MNIARVKFNGPQAFQTSIKARVERYFSMTGRSPRDCPQMYFKAAILFTWLIASYILLVFMVDVWWSALLASVSLGLSMAAVGFNIQHDGGHKAFSSRPWVNRLMAMSLDLLGASSFTWDHKHNTIHHTYANITDHDDDIDVGWFGRLAPEQRRIWFHRVQHIYLWLLYGFLPIRWQLLDDFRDVARGRVGTYRFSRPRGLSLLGFIGGKLLFFGLAFVVPALVHPIGLVLLWYVVAFWINGVVISVVFQLAHVVEEADFPQPEAATGRMQTDWASHQVQTTVDFAQRNGLLTWFLGGLNYQIEHHLFPRVSHIHYPRISRLVKRACQRHGLRYNAHPTFFSALASHFRWLRKMGRRVDLGSPAA